MGSSYRRGPDPLEQGLDRLVSAGRQFVDGVSGARPGSRPQARGTGRRHGALPRLDDLGRWVEDKLDWILEDEDDWREPWQEQPRVSPSPRASLAARPLAAAARRPESQRRRRPLEAISRRALAGEVAAAPEAVAGDWPDDDTFTVPRWQRPAQPERAPLELGAAITPIERDPSERVESSGRPLPRSTRRRRR